MNSPLRTAKPESPTTPVLHPPGGNGNSTTSSLKARIPWRSLGPANISIVYIYVAGFVLFSLWIPDLWLNSVTHQSILNISFAIPGIVALALILPLLGGLLDLSIAGTMSLSTVTVAILMVDHQWPIWAAITAAIAVAVLAGIVNAFLVVTIGINALIATLGTNAILLALADALAGGVQVTGFPDSFTKLTSTDIIPGIQIKIVYLIVVALLLWYVVEHTPFGRYLQATGDNLDATRLAGVRVDRYRFMSLVVSGGLAGLAGVLQTSNVGAANPASGSAFLLPAFAAAFLGATQFKGRFNVWGTLAAIWVLASGVQGVTLAVGSYSWLNNAFFGTALVVAVGLAAILERARQNRMIRRRRREATATAQDPAQPQSPPD